MVLDYDGRSKIENKVDKLCDQVCKNFRAEIESKVNEAQSMALAVVAKEESALEDKVSAVNNVVAGLTKLGDDMDAEATNQQIADFQAEVKDFIARSEMDEKDKKELTEKTVEEIQHQTTKKRSAIRRFVERRVLHLSSKYKYMVNDVKDRKSGIKEKFNKIKKSVKAVGTSENVAKASRALGGIATSVGKFMEAKNADGSVDGLKVIDGVLSILDGLSNFLPPPASAISGVITSVFGMFVGGGGPSTQQVVKEEFAKQKRFIEEQFLKQEKVIEQLLTKTELERVKSKSLGVLDALNSRYEFIEAYEGLGNCLKDEVIAEITNRVEYFMDESDVLTIKHTFDQKCSAVMTSGKELDSQTTCGFLLYTYLILEEKRQEILTIMISLLSLSEGFEELNYGYINVQSNQKDSLSKWISKTFKNSKVYCGLFVYHKDAWYNPKQMEDVKRIIKRITSVENTVKCDGHLGENSSGK